jgi:hypothetical protein
MTPCAPVSRPLRALLVAVSILCGGSLAVRAARAEAGRSFTVLVFSGSDGSAPGDRSDQAVVDALRHQGYAVQLTTTPDQWDGSQEDLSSYDAALLLNGYNRDTGDMPEPGQQALREFVESGGGLVTGEWLCSKATWEWDVDDEGNEFAIYDTLGALLPADADLLPDDTSFDTTWERSARDPVLQDTLPVSFTLARSLAPADELGGSEAVLYAKEGATPFFFSYGVNGDAVVGWDWEGGRVLSLSVPITAASVADMNFRRLLSNAIRWSVQDVAITAFELEGAAFAGGETMKGRVRLSGQAMADLVVSVSSSSPSVSVPATVTVPEGSYGVDFDVTADPVALPTDAAITVRYHGGSKSASVTVNPYAVASLIPAPRAVAGGAGRTAVAKVRLAHPAAPGDITVALSSSNLAVASIPDRVIIPAGTDGSDGSGDVVVNTTAVTRDTAVTLTASTAGGTKTAILTVQPVPAAGISVNPSSFPGGTPAAQVTGLVTLAVEAVAGGTPVTLTSNNPAVAQPVDASGNGIGSVTVPEGKRQATFRVKSSAVTAQTPVTFLASAGEVTKSATLTVNPVGIASFALSTASLSGGKPLQGSIKLDAPAGPGDLTVTLTSSDPALVTVPASHTIPAGKDGSEGSGAFTVTTAPVETAATVTVTAALGTASASAAVTLQAPATPGNVKVSVGATNLTRSILWTDTSDNETGFRLLRKIGEGAYELWKQVGPGTGGTVEVFDDGAAVTEVRYAYRVQSYVEAGGRTYLSGLSNESVGVPLERPINLTATRATPSSTTIKLTWTDKSGLEGGFSVERKAGAGAYVPLPNLAPAAGTDRQVEFTDTVDGTKTYLYRVRAILSTADGVTRGSSKYTELAAPLAPPRIKLTPAALEFGKVRAGKQREAQVNVQNLDHHPMNLRLGAPGSPFVVAGDTTFTLRAGEARTLTVRFRPRQAGRWKRQFAVNCPDGTCVTAKLTGRAER